MSTNPSQAERGCMLLRDRKDSLNIHLAPDHAAFLSLHELLLRQSKHQRLPVAFAWCKRESEAALKVYLKMN